MYDFACKNEGLDLKYTLLLNNVTLGRHDIIGWKTSRIIWKEDQSRWNIENMKTGKVLAYTNSTHDYPLGVREWYFTSGLCKDLGAQKYRRMNLNSCKENEFSCDDGKCVDMKLRCDRSYHCEDFSDEKETVVVLELLYHKLI